MDRVFIDQAGKLYKATEPKNPGDAEMTFPTKDILKALTSEPCTREVMLGRINHVEFNREEPVLAEDSGNVRES